MTRKPLLAVFIEVESPRNAAEVAVAFDGAEHLRHLLRTVVYLIPGKKYDFHPRVGKNE